MTAPLPSGAARVAGVIGWPVAHSRSPRLHAHWLRAYGLDGAYVPLAVRPERLAEAVMGLRALGFVGANLTVPHKEAVVALCDRVDPAAARIGAVNTLVISEDSYITGRNTDAFGFLENLRQGHPAWDPVAGPALVLGAGGAARAIVVGLLEAGAPEIRIANRGRARAEEVAALDPRRCQVIDWAERAPALAGCHLLINATSLGMTGHAPLELALDELPREALVNDIVYTPLETPLLAMARARNNPTVDGLGMLLHQARGGFQAWFGVDPEVTPELRAVVLGT